MTVTGGDAIAAIRHVVQEHAGAEYRLGLNADLDAVRWVAALLGWRLPEEYLQIIAVHDGAMACDACLFDTRESFFELVRMREFWHRDGKYCPVGSDGSGSYWAISIADAQGHSQGEVVFFDHAESDPDRQWSKPTRADSATFPDFVYRRMTAQCHAVGCAWPALFEGAASMDTEL